MSRIAHDAASQATPDAGGFIDFCEKSAVFAYSDWLICYYNRSLSGIKAHYSKILAITPDLAIVAPREAHIGPANAEARRANNLAGFSMKADVRRKRRKYGVCAI